MEEIKENNWRTDMNTLRYILFKFLIIFYWGLLPHAWDDGQRPTFLKGFILKQNKSRHQFFYGVIKHWNKVNIFK